MATYKQVNFIQKLMNEKNLDSSTYNSVEAQTVRSGRGEVLSTRQASDFIELLLSLNDKGVEVEEPEVFEKVILAIKDENGENREIKIGTESDEVGEWEVIIHPVNEMDLENTFKMIKSRMK